MKPSLKEGYPPGWQGFPMQMSPKDLELWVRFKEEYAREFKQFYFDVLIGDPVIEAPEEELNIRMYVEQTSRLRIDAVGEKDDEWWLMELRPNAAAGAIGSILTYKTLWEEDPPDRRLVTPVIVTDNTNKNIVRVCAILKIIIILV